MSILKDIYPEKREKNGFTYFYFLKYYPTRYKVSEEFQQYRNLIYEFKEGLCSGHLYRDIAKNFDLNNLSSPTNDWWLCIVPASTAARTQERFKFFCVAFCLLKPIRNGYSLITNSCDREEVHLADNRQQINLLDYVDFKDVKGKNILLFDDVYTSGRSFVLFAKKLKSLGANQVIGLFLGKSHWMDDVK